MYLNRQVVRSLSIGSELCMKKRLLLKRIIKENALLYAGAFAGMALSGIVSLGGPLVIRFTIDSVIGNMPVSLPAPLYSAIEVCGGLLMFKKNIWMCAVLLAGLTLITGVFSYIKSIWSAKASESISKKLRNLMYKKIQTLPYISHSKYKTGDLIQRATSDIDMVRRFLSIQLIEIGYIVLMIAVVFIIMLSIDVTMTILSVFILPFVMAFSMLYLNVIRKQYKICEEAEAALSTTLQENVAGVRVVKAFGREKHEFSRYDAKNTEYSLQVKKIIDLYAFYWSFSDMLSLLQLVVMTVAGVIRAALGILTLGDFVLFVTYTGMILWPVRQLGRILADYGKMQVSFERINEILDMQDEDMNEHGIAPQIKGDIEFKDVWFEYDSSTPVLKGVSFKAGAGKTTAILGPTGSGKSSLILLLQRIYDHCNGEILIDGIDIRCIDKKWLRQHIGIVLQEPFLYSRTIRENIRIAREDAGDEAVINAAATASVHEVVCEFENGYDTLVGERGVTLSGGQKQRVAVARSLLRECPVVVFDDSLSAVDTETDARIRQALKEREKKATTFIISHRISTLCEADWIIVLEDGRVVQQGTHAKLLEQEGLYKRTWELQMKDEVIV